MHGWLNIYKPRGISSAKLVAQIKKYFPKTKIGHTGTLDLEAEGILPLALGEATKLVSILIDAKKQYEFTLQFGASTDTGDSAGQIINTTDYLPSGAECQQVVSKFIGKVEQTPPIYSALKVNGQRAYTLARAGKSFELAKRQITIYDLKCTSHDAANAVASFSCLCSKGTYIRTLAEDIALSLQSLGFVLELRRSKVGQFDLFSAIDMAELAKLDDYNQQKAYLESKCFKVEDVLADIPVLVVDATIMQKIRYGQICYFDQADQAIIWISHNEQIVAIGSLTDKIFQSSRVFNL